MKILLIAMLFPMCAMAQVPGRQDDSLRKMSDTMHFPEPFTFKTSGVTKLSGKLLFKKCYAWVMSVKDSLNGIRPSADTLHGKIIASNVPATADISFAIVIQVKGYQYICSLEQYLYHTINGKELPVNKAAMIKDYKATTNVERVLIMRNYHTIFGSLAAFVKAN